MLGRNSKYGHHGYAEKTTPELFGEGAAAPRLVVQGPQGPTWRDPIGSF
jgi:hypothetical protein